PARSLTEPCDEHHAGACSKAPADPTAIGDSQSAWRLPREREGDPGHRTAVSIPPAWSSRSLRFSGERHEVVVAELEHAKARRVAATVRDQMGTARQHRVRLATHQADVLLGLTQEDAQGPLDDEERVLHARVIVPRYALARADLQFRDAKPRSLGMV